MWNIIFLVSFIISFWCITISREAEEISHNEESSSGFGFPQQTVSLRLLKNCGHHHKCCPLWSNCCHHNKYCCLFGILPKPPALCWKRS
ncbi:unnamed protein product [Nezara viridula]|uniref:Neuropeptide n=1 Tax=Nezara viridula TaxID=85310 RepID=A0A9P0HHY2_NEZVI|nr:unnamed protein product [Nezara viridula]